MSAVVLGLRLLASGALRRADFEAALLLHASEGVPFVRALLRLGAIEEATLEEELARSELPFMRAVAPVPFVASALPKGLCRRLLAVPVRRDPYTGTVDIAVADPYDSHVEAELRFHLGKGVRMVRAPWRAIEEALASLEKKDIREDTSEPSVPIVEASPPPPSVIDLAPDSPPVSAFRGPFSPNAPRPPFAEIDPVLARIRKAGDRDGVVEGLVQGMQTIARRVGVLVVKKGELAGWVCNPELADIEAFRSLRIPAGPPSVFAAALSKGSYLGPIAKTEGNEALLDVMKEATNDVSITVVEVARRPALLLLADELGDTLLATKRAAKLAEVAGEVLAKLVRGSAR